MREKRIAKLVSEIVEGFQPEKVILFGSFASGKPDRDSDIDLMVIMKTRENTLETAVNIRQSVNHTFPIDIIVRTPRQIKERLRMGDSFIKEVVEKGKVLYEAPG
jgi:uncharacterized protein